ncbi:sulfide:quinone oxidoreductase [Luminiphilus syltensis NOR5-1B]|uniref:Sulfide:quinone oxidoreductase n=1 Tax=Luminiphilus syltensis NOR5-1B TaxID=565045 RepID=B8KSC1_9GAMM|nr:FAD/NAD(P)-binding oxidoreductase [Luminiphilus syltensis]EED34964.1 sulfide:quinone oxidoreductase [Luminiphilus syltensis NOR5-1B]
MKNSTVSRHFDVAVVGAGAGGIAVCASLLNREPRMTIALIDPATMHYYQPGWTMVGGGIFNPESTGRPMASVIPPRATWIQQSVSGFDPDNNRVVLDDDSEIAYDRLVVSAGLTLNWSGIDGLEETLGRNGVTSNYRYDMAPYTWQLVQGMKTGKALFTQPPMPIKCAGAPQKAMYLSSDHWTRTGVINTIDVQFYTATPGLFGVQAYVPALMKYIERYGATLNFQHTLTRIDGERKIATFSTASGETIESDFDMIHVCPPQCAPAFVAQSPLSDDAGWVDVDQNTLQHKHYDNIWALGDCISAPNAKTAAAARAQAPVVALNLLQHAGKAPNIAHYDGYGSCPLTVERGKIVLAEFGYGGKLLPSFPKWIINGEEPSRLAWLLKSRALPWIYWNAMLKGREWMAAPVQQV